jgi:hypothetical protein
MLALGLLVAVALTGLLADAPASGCRRAGCAPALVSASAASDRHVPAHDPCRGDPACGGAITTAHAIAVGVVGLAGALLAAWRGCDLPRLPLAVLSSAVLVGGVDHPPRHHG